MKVLPLCDRCGERDADKELTISRSGEQGSHASFDLHAECAAEVAAAFDKFIVAVFPYTAEERAK